MAEPRLPASTLERAIGQLIEAGVVERHHLAACLGLEPQHVARPLRHLTLASAVREDPDGSLRLTDSGREWLAVEAIAPSPEPVPVPRPTPPQLRPVDLDADVDPLPDEGAATAAGQRPPGWTVSVRLPVALARPVALPVAVVAVGLLAVASAGLAQRPHAAVGTPPVDLSQPAASAPALATAISVPSPSPLPPVLWRVAHTGGVGLVLRPEPGSTARLRTLSDGAPVAVTGAAVQQDGRAWLPVRLPTGDVGWVAADFVEPDR